jgi:hypothetical protein
MKETPLISQHVLLGAKMARFAGYNMPIRYEAINTEHETVRDAVGFLMCKNKQLTDDNAEIDGRIFGSNMVLRTEFIKKV